MQRLNTSEIFTIFSIFRPSVAWVWLTPDHVHESTYTLKYSFTVNLIDDLHPKGKKKKINPSHKLMFAV